MDREASHPFLLLKNTMIIIITLKNYSRIITIKIQSEHILLGCLLIKIFRRDKVLGKSDNCGASCESELGKCTLMNRKYPAQTPLECCS